MTSAHELDLLLTEAAAGSHTAFTGLWHLMAPPVLGYLRAQGADEPEDFSRPRRKRQVGDSGEVAVAFGERENLDHGRRNWPPPAPAASSHPQAVFAAPGNLRKNSA